MNYEVGHRRSMRAAHCSHSSRAKTGLSLRSKKSTCTTGAGAVSRRATMMKQGRRLPATLLTVAAASLASVMFTSYASAQCLECDEYQNRDPFTQGLVTTPPANQPGTTSANRPQSL